jgi:hypothetical protein
MRHKVKMVRRVAVVDVDQKIVVGSDLMNAIQDH